MLLYSYEYRIRREARPVDAEQAWMAELDDLDEPPDEELTSWFDSVDEGGACPAGERSILDAEGSVPDLIAAVLEASGEPALMTDADLVDSLAAWHAIASRAVGRELRATVELLRRRKPRVWDRRSDRTGAPDGADRADAEEPEPVMPAVVASREAAAEIALALNATEYSAYAQAGLAADLSRRLPASFCELDAGRADLYRVRLLAEATQFLSDEDAGKVDSLLAPSLGQMTTGDLRDKARKAVIKIDAKAADRRRERAERKARFALYGNEDHTATAAVERMPAHLGAAVKARVNAIARAAKAAGMTDPMPLLEAKVATGLLLDTLPEIPPPADDGSAGGPAPGGPHDPGPADDPWDGGWPSDWFTRPGFPTDAGEDAPADRRDATLGETGPEPESNLDQPGPDGSGPMTWPSIPVQAGAEAPGCLGVPAWLRPKNPGRIRLIVPWRSLMGMCQEPGEVSWIGPVTPGQARELAVAAAADADCTWRLIVTDDEGRAIAVTTLRARRGTGAGPPGLVSEVTLTISKNLAAAFGRTGQTGDSVNNDSLARLLAKAIPAANLAAAEAADRMAADRVECGCAHTMEVPGYRVPDRLRRWLNTRDRTCRSPICRQPATRCDQDHTTAYHRGGRTCSCNLGGVCRAHHALKQLPGWHLSQDSGGNFTWRTPAGLTYRKEPHRYAV
jgi:Domain of unknown function (DUF222)